MIVQDILRVAFRALLTNKLRSFLNLLGPEMAEQADAVIDRWRQNDSMHDRTPGVALRKRRAGNLRALVGQSTNDALHLDLRCLSGHDEAVFVGQFGLWPK